MPVLVIDIDDTILMRCNIQSEEINYELSYPNIQEIQEINNLKSEGYIIILHTGRNWDKYEFTKKQLTKYGIIYDELVMGKPQGIYIDKNSYKTIIEYIKSNGGKNG